ncbi:hypothetical protein DU68_01585 [Methanosarcina mazei]|uniref:Uncharacterized protein n=1 Tax=Methanosarcina mazei TaxID=2209 RepID=A0A0F8GHP2_METMZ|nr:hypothetical protein DU34_18225 [Methanosarcina mazei]KKG34153.1 hypothetical protein DU49_19075 [Methanosarcina mazei]KKG38688.1 hypothetical protein DU41_19450 [Methanosarcina mazei]KKG42500.1 hypothetical protein DU35_17770 [Methanosarcina mazei]KKG42749.1 hypothetical protein DU39_02295 [Methanosarcina mazei]
MNLENDIPLQKEHTTEKSQLLNKKQHQYKTAQRELFFAKIRLPQVNCLVDVDRQFCYLKELTVTFF